MATTTAALSFSFSFANELTLGVKVLLYMAVRTFGFSERALSFAGVLDELAKDLFLVLLSFALIFIARSSLLTSLRGLGLSLGQSLLRSLSQSSTRRAACIFGIVTEVTMVPARAGSFVAKLKAYRLRPSWPLFAFTLAFAFAFAFSFIVLALAFAFRVYAT